MKEVLISGYYGFDNAGDEAVLQAILDTLKIEAPFIKPVVLSANPEKTTKAYNVNAVNRFKFAEVYKAINNSHGLISGGGSLLQDETGLYTIPYYLGVIKLAQLLGKPTFIYSQGIGPVNRKMYYPLIKGAFNRAKYISVRDKDSSLLLNKMGVPANQIDVVTDPVLSLNPLAKEDSQRIMEKEGIKQAPVFISVRFWKENKEYLNVIAKVADDLVKMGEQVVLIPMHEPSDRAASQYIVDKMNEKAIILGTYDAKALMGIIGEGKCMIGMRLHSIIFATAMGIPSIGISYDPKIDRFLAKLNQTPVGTTDDLDYKTLLDQLKHVLNHLEDNKLEVNKNLAYLKVLAVKPAKRIAEFYK